MKKPVHAHTCAITRAQNLLETGIDVTNKPKLAKSIQKDIVLLCEVRDILFHLIENPTLPFAVLHFEKVRPELNPVEDEPNEAI